MKNVIVERVIHDGESRVTLRFPYDTELISVVVGAQQFKDDEAVYACKFKEHTEYKESI